MLSREELLEIICWLCATYTDMDDARYEALKKDDLEECKDVLCFKFPVVQGTSNQLLLNRLGKFSLKTLSSEKMKALEAEIEGKFSSESSCG